jgi:hypothetical protein
VIAQVLRHGRASVAALALATACAASHEVTVVQEVTVRLGPSDSAWSGHGPSARYLAAAREVGRVLGHRLVLEIDPALEPSTVEALESALTGDLEFLASELDRWQKRDADLYDQARRRLTRIVARYRPGSAQARPEAHVDPDGAVVVDLPAQTDDVIAIGAVTSCVERESKKAIAAAWAGRDPGSLRPPEQAEYAKWLDGDFDDRSVAPRERLARIPLALRLLSTAGDGSTATRAQTFLVDSLNDFARGRWDGEPSAAPAADALASWLERDFPRLPDEQRHEVITRLLDSSAKQPRLLECAFRLSVRVVDAWRDAGHPLRDPSQEHAGARVGSEAWPVVEEVVCPRPKDERDNRSLVPHCSGGIVRLALATPAGATRLGELLAERKDPILVEQAILSAGRGSAGDADRRRFALVRAVESDPACLRRALRVLAEDVAENVSDATRDVWIVEMRRLWLAHPGARGTILYVLVHLDRYGHGDVHWSDFASDFGARVTADEAKAYLDEGYRAISLAWIVWPTFARGFSRAALLRPLLEAYVENPLVHTFYPQDPYQSFLHIRDRLCEERARQDLSDLSAHFAALATAHPGSSFGSHSQTFDPRTACQ